MKFQIVYDKPGRIRFRCGAYAFDKELETAVQKQMLEHPAVKKAEAHSENGGILVYYEEGARNKVIRAVSALDTRMLIRFDRRKVRSESTRISKLIWSSWSQSATFRRRSCLHPSPMRLFSGRDCVMRGVPSRHC